MGLTINIIMICSTAKRIDWGRGCPSREYMGHIMIVHIVTKLKLTKEKHKRNMIVIIREQDLKVSRADKVCGVEKLMMRVMKMIRAVTKAAGPCEIKVL